MKEFCKFIDKYHIEVPPRNKGMVSNYNLNEELLIQDGYKPLIVKEEISEEKTITFYEDKGDEVWQLAEKESLDVRNEKIRSYREEAFKKESDPLKYDYEEALAQKGSADSEVVSLKEAWLNKKKEIRERFPYDEI